MARGSASKAKWSSQKPSKLLHTANMFCNPCHMPHCLVTAIFNPCRMQQWRLKQSTAMWATLGAGSSNATLFGPGPSKTDLSGKPGHILRLCLAPAKPDFESKPAVFWNRFLGAAEDSQCGARDCAKREGFVAVSKRMAGVGHMQRIWQDVFRVAGAVHETCSSELLGGQGADFRKGVAFWKIRSSGLLR